MAFGHMDRVACGHWMAWEQAAIGCASPYGVRMREEYVWHVACGVSGVWVAARRLTPVPFTKGSVLFQSPWDGLMPPVWHLPSPSPGPGPSPSPGPSPCPSPSPSPIPIPNAKPHSSNPTTRLVSQQMI